MLGSSLKLDISGILTNKKEEVMELIILTGMSGAGKSQAANFLEDQGFFCIDNLPPMILPELVFTFFKGQGGTVTVLRSLRSLLTFEARNFSRVLAPQ